MLLTISEFSFISGLPAQTLRFYHSEGLLVPESVDEQTRYRSYAAHQVEQALLITTLRRAGFSVRDVRRALDDRDRAAAMVDDQVHALSRQRRREDQAIAEARSLLTSWPEVQLSRYTGQTVLSALVPPQGEAQLRSGEDGGERWYDWDRADQSFRGTVRELRELAVACHLDEAGAAWRTPALETSQQKLDSQTAAGPHAIAKLPVVVPDTASLKDALPPHVEVQTWFSRDEIGIRLPGRLTPGNYAVGLNKMLHHDLEGTFPDMGPGGERVVVHDDAFDLSLALCLESDSDESRPRFVVDGPR